MGSSSSIGSLVGGGIGMAVGGPGGAMIGSQLGGAIGGSIGGSTAGGSKVSIDANSNIANQAQRQKEIDERMKAIKNQQASQYAASQQGAVTSLQGLAGDLKNQPSVVQQQVAQNQQANLENTMAQAASQRGGAFNPALALRQQQQAQAQGNQAILSQSMPAALQEQNQQLQNQINIQNQIGQLSSQGRSQDQAQFQAQQQLIAQYLQLGLTQDQAQTQANIDLAKAKAGVQSQNIASQNQMLGGLLSTAGQLGAAYLGS